MAWYWDHYLPRAEDRAHPDASPLRAPELCGVAPALVITAEHDVLRDEGEEYAERLRRAGALLEVRRQPGQLHGFFSMVNLLPASAEAIGHVSRVTRDLVVKEDVGE